MLLQLGTVFLLLFWLIAGVRVIVVDLVDIVLYREMRVVLFLLLLLWLLLFVIRLLLVL